MNKYLSELAAGLKPYVPGEQPKDKKYVKLNTNENPYPPSEKVTEAIVEAARDLRLYPDPQSTELRKTIADYYNKNCQNVGKANYLNADNIFVGNGSDEVLGFCFPAFFSGRKVVFPDVTYSFYPVYANLFKTDFDTVPLTDDFSVIVEDYISIPENTSGILLPNPNAPTGKCLALEDIETIVKNNAESIVIIDEAYIDFGGESAVKLVPKYENLLVVQTLSKSRSLAGLRLGFAVGSERLIDGLVRVKDSFNSYPVDRLASAGAIAAILDEEYFDRTRKMIMNTREEVAKKLREMNFTVVPSKSNFLFISHKEKSAQEILSILREKGVLVRYFNKPRIDNYLRVTVGTDEEMKNFLKCVMEIVKISN